VPQPYRLPDVAVLNVKLPRISTQSRQKSCSNTPFECASATRSKLDGLLKQIFRIAQAFFKMEEVLCTSKFSLLLNAYSDLNLENSVVSRGLGKRSTHLILPVLGAPSSSEQTPSRQARRESPFPTNHQK
jgi:hypothetical protein